MSKYTKAGNIVAWANLDPDQPIMPQFVPLKPEATGSTYGACGIRIDGTPEFIDAVLSHLKELTIGEGVTTRLTMSRQEVKPVTINGSTKRFENVARRAEVCYIRLHERTIEGAMAAAFSFGNEHVKDELDRIDKGELLAGARK